MNIIIYFLVFSGVVFWALVSILWFLSHEEKLAFKRRKK